MVRLQVVHVHRQHRLVRRVFHQPIHAVRVSLIDNRSKLVQQPIVDVLKLLIREAYQVVLPVPQGRHAAARLRKLTRRWHTGLDVDRVAWVGNARPRTSLPATRLLNTAPGGLGRFSERLFAALRFILQLHCHAQLLLVVLANDRQLFLRLLAHLLPTHLGRQLTLGFLLGQGRRALSCLVENLDALHRWRVHTRLTDLPIQLDLCRLNLRYGRMLLNPHRWRRHWRAVTKIWHPVHRDRRLLLLHRCTRLRSEW